MRPESSLKAFKTGANPITSIGVFPPGHVPSRSSPLGKRRRSCGSIYIYIYTYIYHRRRRPFLLLLLISTYKPQDGGEESDSS